MQVYCRWAITAGKKPKKPLLRLLDVPQLDVSEIQQILPGAVTIRGSDEDVEIITRVRKRRFDTDRLEADPFDSMRSPRFRHGDKMSVHSLVELCLLLQRCFERF